MGYQISYGICGGAGPAGYWLWRQQVGSVTAAESIALGMSLVLLGLVQVSTNSAQSRTDAILIALALLAIALVVLRQFRK